MRGFRRSLGFVPILSAALGFASSSLAADCGQLGRVATLDLKPSAGSRPIVSAMIGDTPVDLLIDTGGVFSALNPWAVRTLNLRTFETAAQMTDIAGQTSNHGVRLPPLTLGRLRQEGLNFMVLPEADGPNAPHTIAGVLAPNILMNLDLDFDFGAHKLNLISQNHCDGKVLYWAAPAVAIVPFRAEAGGHVSFPVTLNGKRVTGILDTGASDTLLNLTVAQQTYDIDVNAPDVERRGANFYRKRFDTLAIEGVTVSAPMITLIPDRLKVTAEQRPLGSLIRDTDYGLPDLILGMSVLSKLHVYIAYKEHKVYITAANPEPATVPPAQ
jgi:predicted aspartyl protease